MGGSRLASPVGNSNLAASGDARRIRARRKVNQFVGVSAVSDRPAIGAQIDAPWDYGTTITANKAKCAATDTATARWQRNPELAAADSWTQDQ